MRSVLVIVFPPFCDARAGIGQGSEDLQSDALRIRWPPRTEENQTATPRSEKYAFVARPPPGRVVSIIYVHPRFGKIINLKLIAKRN